MFRCRALVFAVSTTPIKFMQPVVNKRDTMALTNYLKRRYRSGI